MIEPKTKLIVYEEKNKNEYYLDSKDKWTFGRISKNNKPDISVHSKIVSRHHGIFTNIDGIWFYIDNGGLNGTYYNKQKINISKRGNRGPIMLDDGDELQVNSTNLNNPDSRAVKIEIKFE